MSAAPLAELERTAGQHGLILMGVCHGDADDGGMLALLGTGPGFWPVFTGSDEYGDGRADPLDRWSKRVIGGMAQGLGARCHFPSDGPPYPPFIRWALRSGRFFSSPVGMMVHDQAGLMVSLRGAVQFDSLLDIPAEPSPPPCDACHRPCEGVCPVDALGGAAGYDVAACHAHLDSPAGASCLSDGCLARRACPVSARFGRDPAQSAFHMAAFHP